jgi:actin related protein 2/3 complex, subunit 1A/1B
LRILVIEWLIENPFSVFLGKMDVERRSTQPVSGTAMKMFQQMVSRAQSEASDISLDSVHQNSINCMRVYERSGNEVTKIATSGWDGRLVIWNIADITSQFSSLRI